VAFLPHKITARNGGAPTTTEKAHRQRCAFFRCILCRDAIFVSQKNGQGTPFAEKKQFFAESKQLIA